jgi:hypothetical protein
MSIFKMPKVLSLIWQQSFRIACQFDDRTLGWPGLLIGAAKLALLPGSSIKAAPIAYFALFSLFPLILLSISIASFTIDPLIGQQFICAPVGIYCTSSRSVIGKKF